MENYYYVVVNARAIVVKNGEKNIAILLREDGEAVARAKLDARGVPTNEASLIAHRAYKIFAAIA